MQKILLVTENKNDILELADLLENRYELRVAKSLKMAARIALEEGTALILADVSLAEEGLKANEFTDRLTGEGIPIIFITEGCQPEDIARVFGLGGQDYIAKPFFAAEVYARLRPHLQFRQTLTSLRECVATLELKNRQLRDISEQLDNVARIDLLTGIPNRSYMLERLKEEAARSFRHQRTFTIMVVKIDNFTAILDNYGPDCGDFVLQSVVDILRTKRRGEDVVARWAGEVFMVMLPETYMADGGRVAERIRARIEDAQIDYSGRRFSVTGTIGVAEFGADTGVEGTVKKVVMAVTEGKQAGMNSVVLLPE